MQYYEISIPYIKEFMSLDMGFPRYSHSKEPTSNVGDPGSIPGLGRSPGEREWQPTLVFLPEEFHGQSSLVFHSPRGLRRVGHYRMTKGLTLSLFHFS